MKDQVIEQVGSIDPMANERNEKLVALNLERIRYWLGEGAEVSKPAADILGKETNRFVRLFVETSIQKKVFNQNRFIL